MPPIEAGQPAPEFSLATYEGNRFTREDLLGRITVLVFYPFAFSPVCTEQLAIYQEVLEDFEARGVTLYGVPATPSGPSRRSATSSGSRSSSCRTSSPRARPAARSACCTRAASPSGRW